MEDNKFKLLGVGIDVDRRVIILNGVIGEDLLERVALAHSVLDFSSGPFRIDLTTPGGSVEDGLAIYDLVRLHQKNAHIHVHGYAHSMGCYILQAAGRRTVSANGTIMAHWGNQVVEDTSHENFKRKLEYNKRLDNICDHILLERALEKDPKVTLDTIVSRTKSDWYMSPSEALAWGFVDEIIGSGPVLSGPRPRKSRAKKVKDVD